MGWIFWSYLQRDNGVISAKAQATNKSSKYSDYSFITFQVLDSQLEPRPGLNESENVHCVKSQYQGFGCNQHVSLIVTQLNTRTETNAHLRGFLHPNLYKCKSVKTSAVANIVKMDINTPRSLEKTNINMCNRIT